MSTPKDNNMPTTPQPNLNVSWPVLFGVLLLGISLLTGAVGATSYIVSNSGEANKKISSLESRVSTLEAWVETNGNLPRDIQVVKEVLQRVDARLERMEDRYYRRPGSREN